MSRANLCDAHSIYGMRQPKQPSRCPSKLVMLIIRHATNNRPSRQPSYTGSYESMERRLYNIGFTTQCEQSKLV
ncbi:hypothetical protein J6590_058966 [Homalodisca vitripennis]|nr:hypothetical protein J6590_058966 [Homalodisca vitripennis]